MAAKKVGTLIREARLEAGYTQEQLARKVKGLTANDISKAERGEKDLTKEQLKKIALATGVTQSSLLNAPKGGSSSSSSKMKLVELYREADSDRKKMAMNVLKGESNTFDGFLGNLIDGALDALKK